MTYKEKQCDLFSMSGEYWLAHCISADFGMGKGIVIEFNTRFNMKQKMFARYKVSQWNGIGYCCPIEEDKVFNLITKEKYWGKPTYKTLQDSLVVMKQQCQLYSIDKIAMPKIGAGLDKLKWEKVSKIIREVFEDIEIELLICYL